MEEGGRHATLRFDRGTVVVDTDAVELAANANLTWDSRIDGLRGPAWKHGAIAAGLAERGMRVRDDVLRGGEPPSSWGTVDLRPYQEAAFDAWQLGARRGLVVLPTGSGKTRVALAAMARTGARALCLVPTRVLLDQWVRAIGELYPGTIGRWGDGRRDVAAITVATFESAYRHMDELGDRFELLVVDEAHHFGNAARDEALEMSAAPLRLGLTATPPAGAVAERLHELVGPTVFELTIGDLAGRFLASFDAITIHVDLAADERFRYETLMGAFGDVHGQFRRVVPGGTWADFVRMAGRTAAGRRAIAAWREARKLLYYPAAKKAALGSLLERHRDARTLVFTADNDTAYAVAREYLVMPLTCDIDRKEREAALERFRTGELRALVSARVLNEGIDVPDADVAVVVAGTMGEREHVQRIGRLLRPREGKRAIVYELVCSRTSEVRHAKRRRRGLAARTSAQL